MRFKALTVLAISSLCAASLVYATPETPSFADDSAMGNTVSDNATATPNTNTDGSVPAAAVNNGNQAPSGQEGVMPSESSNSNDDMSADTATGDDDY
jgi:hypothetical protein